MRVFCVYVATRSYRYVFVHHCDCMHGILVSDIRMEPAPATPTPTPTSVEDSDIPTVVSSSTSTAAAAAPSSAVNGSGEVQPATILSTTVSPAVETTYPRLSYQLKAKATLCAVCQTITADVQSFGHPLADQASESGYSSVSLTSPAPLSLRFP